MLRIIEDERDIRRCQQQMMRHFKPVLTGRLTVKLGHAGGSFPARIAWHASPGIWLYSRKLPEGRYWNVFGLGLPEGSSALPITCEINVPVAGVDRKLGGAFARHRDGRTFVVHRGLIGGAKKGVGKSLFASRFRGVWSALEEGRAVTPVAVIGELSSPRFVRHLSLFVLKIDRLKNLAVASPQLEMSFETVSFREEWIGRAVTETDGSGGLACDHGPIVQDLAAALRARGLRVGNDDRRDLLITDGGGRIGWVLQVIPDSSERAVFDGVAHLLIYGADLPDGCRRVLVLPDGADKPHKERLKKLHVDLLPFAWDENRAVFPDLAALL